MTLANWLTIISLLLLFGGQCWTWYAFNHKAHTEADDKKETEVLYRKEIKMGLKSLKDTVDDPQYGLKALNIKMGDFGVNCASSMSTLTAKAGELERRLDRIDGGRTGGG